MTKGNWASPFNRPRTPKKKNPTDDSSHHGRVRGYTCSKLDRDESENAFRRLSDFEDEFLREQELNEG